MKVLIKLTKTKQKMLDYAIKHRAAINAAKESDDDLTKQVVRRPRKKVEE